MYSLRCLILYGQTWVTFDYNMCRYVLHLTKLRTQRLIRCPQHSQMVPFLVNLCQVFLLLFWLLVTRCMWLSESQDMRQSDERDIHTETRNQTLMHQKDFPCLRWRWFRNQPSQHSRHRQHLMLCPQRTRNILKLGTSWTWELETFWGRPSGFLFLMRWQWDKLNLRTRWAPTTGGGRSFGSGRCAYFAVQISLWTGPSMRLVCLRSWLRWHVDRIWSDHETSWTLFYETLWSFMTLCWFFSRKDPFQLCLCYSGYFDMVWLSMFSSLTVADTRQCRLVHHNRQYFLAVNGCVVSPLCSWSRLVLGHLAQIWCINPGDMWRKLTSPLCSNMASETICVLVELPNPVLLYGIATPGKLLFHVFWGYKIMFWLFLTHELFFQGQPAPMGGMGGPRAQRQKVCAVWSPKSRAKIGNGPGLAAPMGQWAPKLDRREWVKMVKACEFPIWHIWIHMEGWTDEHQLFHINSHVFLDFGVILGYLDFGVTQISKQRSGFTWPWSNRIQNSSEKHGSGGMWGLR